VNREQERILKSLLDERKAWQVKLLGLVCEANERLSKYMYVLSRFFEKQFTSKDLPFKSTQSCELIKTWHDKGLIMKASYAKKTNEYKIAPTLFIKAVESSNLKPEEKKAVIALIDEII